MNFYELTMGGWYICISPYISTLLIQLYTYTLYMYSIYSQKGVSGSLWASWEEKNIKHLTESSALHVAPSPRWPFWRSTWKPNAVQCIKKCANYFWESIRVQYNHHIFLNHYSTSIISTTCTPNIPYLPQSIHHINNYRTCNTSTISNTVLKLHPSYPLESTPNHIYHMHYHILYSKRFSPNMSWINR